MVIRKSKITSEYENNYEYFTSEYKNIIIQKVVMQFKYYHKTLWCQHLIFVSPVRHMYYCTAVAAKLTFFKLFTTLKLLSPRNYFFGTWILHDKNFPTNKSSYA